MTTTHTAKMVFRLSKIIEKVSHAFYCHEDAGRNERAAALRDACYQLTRYLEEFSK